MNGPRAHYAFLPWLRRGVSAAAGASAGGARRLRVPVSISFGAGRDASVVLEMLGPGEIIGLDRRMVARTWPRAGVQDAEPNFFPLVEFDQADLPWRYSPVTPPSDDRLAPWLCLLVLRDEEIGERVPASATRPLPVVQVRDAPLPSLAQAWAWAHAQVAGADTIGAAEASALLAAEPHRLTARLLCPRRLDPQTTYTALLVPAFESGRRAGLGLPADAAADPLAPSWATGVRSAVLPVYYQWRFGTGAAGDFEELVKRLTPDVLPDAVGIRAMDVGDPGAALPPAAAGPLGLEGALRSPTMARTPWPDAERAPFVGALRAFLNRPQDLLEQAGGVRAVSAPLYGRWHAAQDLLAPGAEPRWFQEVNADPRWRVAAGLGAQVIQANQRQLLDSAWRQAGGLPQVNDALRGSQFSRELALQVQQRHLRTLSDELVLQVTGPVHRSVLASPTKIAARLAESPVAEGLVSAGWRRVARPLGAIGRRQARPRGEQPRVVARVNRQELSPAPPPPTPETLPTPSRAGRGLVPAWATAASLERLRAWARRLVPIGAALLVGGFAALLLHAPPPLVVLLALLAAAAFVGAWRIGPLAARIAVALALRDGTLTPEMIDAIPGRPGFVATASELVGGPPDQASPRPGGATLAMAVGSVPVPAAAPGDSMSARAFRQAAFAMLAQSAGDDVQPVALRPVALRALRQRLEAELDPRATIGARLRERVQLADGLVWQPRDPLEPVLAGPNFPQPMYRFLAELSPDWLLPGLDLVRANTVSLAETNQAFVEAYMLGLNHEMSSELLWREYPADQRRTFFRQFWDPTAFVPPPGQSRDPATLEDIRPIHRWAPGAALGENGARTAATGEQLVVLIRGDVVRRYPTITAYAARAVLDAQGRRVPGEDERQPVFSGALEPDVAFFGFPLTEAEVRGSGTPGEGDQGWFFVLQEPASEPRFGLDTGGAGAAAPATWNDLSWGHLVTAAEGLRAVDYIALDAELPDTRGIADPPGVAWHADAGLGSHGTDGAQIAFIALQRPMRVAIHANDMLHA